MQTTPPSDVRITFGVGERGKRKKGVRMGRRHAKLRLVLLIGVFVLALLPNFGTPAVASPRVTGQIVASEHSDAWPAHKGGLSLPNGARITAADAGSTGGATLLYTSDA